MSLEFHGGQDFPAQRATHRRIQFASGPPLAEFPEQLHLPGLAGGILVGSLAEIRQDDEANQRHKKIVAKTCALSSLCSRTQIRTFTPFASRGRIRQCHLSVNDIRKILEATQLPSGRVSSELLPLVYDELRVLAAKRLADESGEHTLQATALVHEAWIAVAGNDECLWEGRRHFFRAASRAMRHILVDRARAKSSQKRGNYPEMVNIEELDIADASLDERVLLVDEMMTKLEQDDPESVRMITLKFFGGLTNKEIAAMEGVTERTVERYWSFARAKLFRMMRAELGEGEQG